MMLYKIPEGTWITRVGGNADEHDEGGVQRMLTTKEVTYTEKDKFEYVDAHNYAVAIDSVLAFELPSIAHPWKYIIVSVSDMN